MLLCMMLAAQTAAAAGLDDPNAPVADTAAAADGQGEDDAQSDADAASTEEGNARRLPLFKGWFEEQGIDLPLPYGAGLMTIFMERDIEITDVTVQFLNRPPESVADRANFDVSNQTRSVAARFDAWILPFINVYALVGEATTDTSLRSVITIEPPNGDPIEVELTDDSQVDGPMGGIGITAVVGGDAWFAMADANYNYAETDLFDEEILVWLYSGRLGWHGSTKYGRVMAWGGLFYMDSERTLTISEEFPLIGETEILVTQRPVDKLTYQVGASMTLNKHWDVLFEAGTNFDDATMLVLSGSYRF